MENERDTNIDLRIEQMRREMLKFSDDIGNRRRSQKALTLADMEKSLSNLRCNADGILLNLVNDMIAETDEKELIKSKKESAGSKE